MNKQKKGRKVKHRKQKLRHFMDAALEGFARDQALRKWDEVESLRKDAQLELRAALKAASVFPEKESYHKIWSQWWKIEVLDSPLDKENELFAKIEKAVQGAVLEEKEQRITLEEELLEDSPTYKAFIARQMHHLLFEAGGETEEFEEGEL